MPYQLLHFSTPLGSQIVDTPLPLAMPVDDLSSGVVESGLMDSIGAAYNYWGTATQFARKQKFTHKGLYVGAVNYRITTDGDYRVTPEGDFRVTSSSKIADLKDQVDNLKSKIGQWGKVWRRSLPDGGMTYKECRLLHVGHVEDVDKAGVVSEIESDFETLDYGWRSPLETLTLLLAAGTSGAIIVTNRGVFPIFDAVLRVTCSSGTITTVTVLGPQIDIKWTGVLAAGQTLVIDSGSQIVPIGSVDAYTGLTFGVGHTSAEWLPLPLGTVAISVGVVGGAATVTLEKSDRWP